AASRTQHVKHRRHQAELQRRREHGESDGRSTQDEARAGERARSGPLEGKTQEEAPIGSQTSFMSLVKKYGRKRKYSSAPDDCGLREPARCLASVTQPGSLPRMRIMFRKGTKKCHTTISSLFR